MKLTSIARARAAAMRSTLFKEFLSSIAPPVRIIDLGGTVSMWERWGLSADDRLRIDLANNFSMDVNNKDNLSKSSNISKVTVDVTTLTTSDYQRYDVIFSNSMLEHLADFEQQRSVAREIVESRRPYFIQVPNKYCLVDPHFAHPLAPFYAAWPRSFQTRMLRISGLNGGARARSHAQAEHRLKFYYPLSKSDMSSLFSDAEVLVERNFGMSMSIVALRRS